MGQDVIRVLTDGYRLYALLIQLAPTRQVVRPQFA